jgi:hypothetical protein
MLAFHVEYLIFKIIGIQCRLFWMLSFPSGLRKSELCVPYTRPLQVLNCKSPLPTTTATANATATATTAATKHYHQEQNENNPTHWLFSHTKVDSSLCLSQANVDHTCSYKHQQQ